MMLLAQIHRARIVLGMALNPRSFYSVKILPRSKQICFARNIRKAQQRVMDEKHSIKVTCHFYNHSFNKIQRAPTTYPACQETSGDRQGLYSQ